MLNNGNPLFVGKFHHRFASLASTNHFALQLLAKSRPAEGTVISTYDQFAGRGQMGNSWQSEGGKNMAFSAIFYPHFLTARRQFMLNQLASLAVADLLRNQLPGADVKVKWPNDVYVADQKLAGILIQNSLSGSQLQWSVIGIGLNVNQREFDPALPNPGSMARLSGADFELDHLLDFLCQTLETRYLQAKSRPEQLESDYTAQLYRRGEWHRFKRDAGEEFEGMVSGVSSQGQLRVHLRSGAEEHFDFKAISFVG